MMLKSLGNSFLTEIPSKSMNNIDQLIFYPLLQVMAYNLKMTFNSIEQLFYFSLVCQNFDSDMKQKINKQTVVTSVFILWNWLKCIKWWKGQMCLSYMSPIILICDKEKNKIKLNWLTSQLSNKKHTRVNSQMSNMQHWYLQ